MLWTILVVLMILWLLGLIGGVGGGPAVDPAGEAGDGAVQLAGERGVDSERVKP